MIFVFFKKKKKKKEMAEFLRMESKIRQSILIVRRFYGISPSIHKFYDV